MTQNVNYALKARYVAGLLDDLVPQPSASQTMRPARQQTLEEFANAAQNAFFLVVAR